jgi:hypothetical protein
VTSYAPPAPPLADGELTHSVHRLRAELESSYLGGCCMCKDTCPTWWSAAPPSGYVPLHYRCAPKLIARWREMMADGDTGAAAAPLAAPSGPMGAYARRAAAAVFIPAAAPTRLASGAVLPEGFTPGPFWRPGDDETTPWTTLLETAAGLTMCPAGRNRAHAEKTLRRYEKQREITFGPAVVGGALFAPGGDVVESWGSVPSPDGPRWVSIRWLSEWQRCPGCGDIRWPGSWVTVEGGRCRDCQAPLEVDDPRPWPEDPAFPGEARIPESFTKGRKITPPASAVYRFRPNLRTGFTSPRKRG